MIDWSQITNELRASGISLAAVSRVVGSDEKHLNRLARGEVNQPKYDVGCKLLSIHANQQLIKRRLAVSAANKNASKAEIDMGRALERTKTAMFFVTGIMSAEEHAGLVRAADLYAESYKDSYLLAMDALEEEADAAANVSNEGKR